MESQTTRGGSGSKSDGALLILRAALKLIHRIMVAVIQKQFSNERNLKICYVGVHRSNKVVFVH